MEFTITAEDLLFSYPRRPDFSLRVERFSHGLCTALTGPNGCGKTTLGKLLVGILRPDAGVIRYAGRDIANLKLGEIGAQVGYLFQEPARQIFAPRVLEEIAFPLILRGVQKEKAEEKARAALFEFGLEKLESHNSYTLSRGEKQRLAIAAAMVFEPRFFVLDEPTTGLDKRRRDMLGAMLKQLMERGVGILLISHDDDFIRQLGADILRMEGGRLNG